MNGSDDPSNLIELTVEEHAEAHRLLFEQYGREEDRIAWLALSGQASKKDIVKLGQKLGRKKTDEYLENKYGLEWRSILSRNANKKLIEKRKQDPEFDMRMRIRNSNVLSLKGSIAALSESSRKKRKETFQKNSHQQGSKNSNYGRFWIHNDELQKSKCLKKDQPIPNGWIVGRKLKWKDKE